MTFWTAGAIVGGAVIGGVASNSAANTQANAANNAAQVQQNQFNTINSQQTPWRQAGSNALGQIGAGFGATGHTAANFDAAAYLQANPDVAADPYWGQNPYQHYLQHGQGEGRQFTAIPSAGIAPNQFTHQFDSNDLNSNLAPNYQWQLGQGLGATQALANSTGGLVSGNTLKAINDYAQNFAGNAYQQAFNNYNAQQTNIFNRLSNVAGLGQTANQTAATAGTQLAGNAGNFLTSAGAAQAAGQVGMANAVNNGIGNYMGWNYLNSSPQSTGSWPSPSGIVPGTDYSGLGGWNGAGANNPSAYVGGGG